MKSKRPMNYKILKPKKKEKKTKKKTKTPKNKKQKQKNQVGLYQTEKLLQSEGNH